MKQEWGERSVQCQGIKESGGRMRGEWIDTGGEWKDGGVVSMYERLIIRREGDRCNKPQSEFQTGINQPGNDDSQ
jgi:hypothetical protein